MASKAISVSDIEEITSATGITTNASATFTDTATGDFVNDGVNAGDTLTIDSNGDKYVVLTVDSATQLTLLTVYDGPSDTGVSYTIASSDDTFYTIPGGSGDLNHEAASENDNTYGASYNSTQPTLANWTASSDGFYKGYAGYTATFLKTGTATTFSTGTCTELTGTTFQVTATAERILDRGTTITASGSVSGNITAHISSVDHLAGIITFDTSYTGETVTITGKYLPTTSVGSAREFTLTMNAETVDTSDFATARHNGGFATYDPGIKTVSIDASGFYRLINGFKTLVTNHTELVISICPDGSNLSVAKGFFKAVTTGQSGDVGGNEDESITFELTVPQAHTDVTRTVVSPFNWYHDASSTLHDSIQLILTNFLAGTHVYVKYLDDGVSGNKGFAVTTDCSLSSSVDGINTFSFSWQGNGRSTVV